MAAPNHAPEPIEAGRRSLDVPPDWAADAEPLLRKSLELRRDLLGEDHEDTLDAMGALGLVLNSRGDIEAAHDLFREAMERARNALGPDDPKSDRLARCAVCCRHGRSFAPVRARSHDRR